MGGMITNTNKITSATAASATSAATAITTVRTVSQGPKAQTKPTMLPVYSFTTPPATATVTMAGM